MLAPVDMSTFQQRFEDTVTKRFAVAAGVLFVATDAVEALATQLSHALAGTSYWGNMVVLAFGIASELFMWFVFVRILWRYRERRGLLRGGH